MIVIFADFTSPINEERSGCCPVDGCLVMLVDVKRDSRHDPRLSGSFYLIDPRAEHSTASPSALPRFPSDFPRRAEWQEKSLVPSISLLTCFIRFIIHVRPIYRCQSKRFELEAGKSIGSTVSKKWYNVNDEKNKTDVEYRGVCLSASSLSMFS